MRNKLIVWYLILFMYPFVCCWCTKNIPPEPKVAPIKNVMKETKTKANSNEALEEFINSIFRSAQSKVTEQNTALREIYCLPLETSSLEEEAWLKNMKILFNISAKQQGRLITVSELTERLKHRKDIVVLEPEEKSTGQQLIIKVDAYYPGGKRYLFSLLSTLEVTQAQRLYLEQMKSKNYVNSSNSASNYVIGDISEEIISMKLYDSNGDNKKDIILLGRHQVHIWIMAYNAVLDHITINVPDENEKASKNPAGFMMMYQDSYLFVINSYSRKGTCIYLKDSAYPVIECPQDAMRYFSFTDDFNLAVAEGKNYFTLTDIQGKEINFHYLNVLEENSEFQDGLLVHSKDNKIMVVSKMDLSILYTLDTYTGRVVSVKNTCLLSSSNAVDCSSESIILYKWDGKGYDKITEISIDTGCVFALDILECNDAEVKFYYSSYNPLNTTSKIYFTSVAIAEKNQ